jgi:hypothetical protein
MRRRKCLHCGVIKADNSGRLVEHIQKLQCAEWKRKQQEAEELRPQRVIGRPAAVSKPNSDPTQTTLKSSFITTERKKALDKLAAMAVYADARPFTLYECPAMKAFLFQLEPAYKPPSAHALANGLLNDIYTETKDQVDTELRASTEWNIVFDESEDIRHHRIINLCICVASGAFFYGEFVLGAVSASAEFLRDWLLEKLREATQDNFSIINSIATDTCPTMFKIYDLLQASDKTRHAIYVPCDSHGLQLLIKDLLELPEFEPAMKAANRIVGYFNRATKQYAFLHEQQLKEYGRQKALILSGITRWGTQLNMVKRLQETKQALRNYAAQEFTGDGKDKWIIPMLLDDKLWDRFGLILQLLAPIHEAQKMSESTKAHLGRVKSRWDHIRAELVQLERQQQFDFVDWPLLWEIFDDREKRQIRPIHFLAQYLVPTNWNLEWFGK